MSWTIQRRLRPALICTAAVPSLRCYIERLGKSIGIAYAASRTRHHPDKTRAEQASHANYIGDLQAQVPADPGLVSIADRCPVARLLSAEGSSIAHSTGDPSAAVNGAIGSVRDGSSR